MHNSRLLRALGYGVALAGILAGADNVPLIQKYCSNQNTGFYSPPVTNPFNSDGSCQTQCESEFAFAIVQYTNCWCSNYAPENQLDLYECSQQCPGYPAELCGNKDQDLYGYIALTRTPYGSAGGYTPPASTSAPPSTYDASSTVSVQTVTKPASVSVKTKASVTTLTPSPVTSVEVVTVSGADVTRTVTSTPMVVPNGGSTDPIQVEHHSGLHGGAIAGVVVGVLVAVALLAIGAFFLMRRRRDDADDGNGNGGDGPRRSPRRNVSVLSKTGLLSRARHSFGERDNDGAGGQPATSQLPASAYVLPPMNTTSTRHSSMMFGAGGWAAGDTAGAHPPSPLGNQSAGSQDGSGGGSRRHSRPFVYDQRLNPSALFTNHDNSSRVSMQDQNDYSRPLGVANPDPRPSFESRISRY